MRDDKREGLGGGGEVVENSERAKRTDVNFHDFYLIKLQQRLPSLVHFKLHCTFKSIKTGTDLF